MNGHITREETERLSPEEIASRLLQPDRPHLQTAIEAVGDATSPVEAWRALIDAGLVPPAWRDAPEREFLQVPDDNLRVSTQESSGPARRPLPSTVKACVSVASIGHALAEQCERDAREAYRELQHWVFAGTGLKPLRAESVLWDVLPVKGIVPAGTRAPSHLRTASFFAREAVRTRDFALFTEKDAEFTQRSDQIRSIAHGRTMVRFTRWHLAEDHAWWSLACARDLVVPKRLTTHDHGGGKAPSKFSGARFRQLPDPFLPVWQIWLRGVGFAACEMEFEFHLPRIL
ncbi:MAG: hypothetical protein U0326_29390 [Polyangiales bacterium]